MAHDPPAWWRSKLEAYPYRVATEPGAVPITEIRVREWGPIRFSRDEVAGVDRWGFKTAEAAKAFMQTYGGRLDG